MSGWLNDHTFLTFRQSDTHSTMIAIVPESQKLKMVAVWTYPTSIWRPRWGDSVEISPRFLASEN